MTAFSREIFERVEVINLPRRKDRWENFLARLPPDWPFRTPHRYEAVDGVLAPPPGWWSGGNGAWGCYRSHFRIVEECLNSGTESVLILEDDAVCIDGIGEKVAEFWNKLPDDWCFVYLGGQHLEENVRLPRKINDWVYEPYNVNRTHCYGLRGRHIIETVYRHLSDNTPWNVPHHIDHYYGVLQKKMETGLYVPREWLFYQSAGKSDINDKLNRALQSPDANSLVNPEINRTGIAILGDYFGGTNTVAGILHYLGIDTGVEMQVPKSTGEPCYFEDRLLGELCRSSYSEPRLESSLSFEDRTNHLRRWAGVQCEKSTATKYYCGKHPILSLMGEELTSAWRDPLFVVVERPSEDSIKSMSRVNWAWSPELHRRANERMKLARLEFLRSFKPKAIRIPFEEMIDRPECQIRKICDFLDHTPTDEQLRRAVEFARNSSDDLCYYMK